MANPWGDDNTWRNVAITAAVSTVTAPALCCCGVFALEGPHGIRPWVIYFLAAFFWVMPPLAALIFNLAYRHGEDRRRGPLGPLWPPK